MPDDSARWYLIPYVRLFPIWRYGPRYDFLDGRYIDDGWYPDRYGQWKFDSEEAALRHKAEALRAR